MLTPDVDRRMFLALSAGSTVGLSLWGLPDHAHAQPATEHASGDAVELLDGFPQQPIALVREAVTVAHGRFERLRELVDRMPELAKCRWDWGFGDWESPIEAASHTGNRDIAAYLIDKGARPTIFTFAMLGDLAVVRAMIESRPELRQTTGPHGLTLAHHARVGGEAAASVRGYLEEIGLADDPVAEIPDDARQLVLGRYAFVDAGGAVFEVQHGKRGLVVKGEGGIARSLVQISPDTFHPVGAPSVRFRFARENERAAGGSLTYGGRSIRFARQS